MRLKFSLLYSLFSLLVWHGIAQAPIEFIKNNGQWGSWVQYKAPTMAGEVFMEQDGFRYLLCDASNALKIDSFHTGMMKTNPTMKFHVYKVSFIGAQTKEITGEKQQKTYYNYFIGNDPNKWKSGIHPFLALNYKDLYHGIDMHISSEMGTMVYEFYISAGTDAGVIKMNFDGPDDMWVKNGNLVINTSVGQVKEMKPYCFQVINDEKVEVACKYKLSQHELTFDFPDGYDHSKQLVIDPTIVFCSFTGSTADNWGFTATYDNAGNFYAGGLVNALAAVGGGAYPVTAGAYQSTFGGGQGNSGIEYGADIGIMKFNSAGTTRIYATYLGGSGNERPFSMIVDTGGNLIVSGRTHSTNFPVTAGAFQTTNHGGWDGIISKFNSNATALLASTYMGGSADEGVNYDSTEIGYGQLKCNYGDDARSEVQVDKAGNIYVTSCTESTDFPTTPGAFSTTFSGNQDGVVYKLNSTLSTLLWSTYIGGSGYDAGYVLAFDTSQTVLYVGGGTNSTNFPVTPGTWHTTYGGDTADGFVLKFQNSPPYTLLKGTYVGTSHYDQVYGLQIDGISNNIWVMGQSIGGTFPVTAGVYNNPNSGQFVMEMDNNLTNDLISTVYGNGNTTQSNISPVAFLVDTCGNVYISGWGGNLGYGPAREGSCTGMPLTADAYQSTTDGYDFYFIVFGPALTTLRYATYYGRYSTTNYYGEHVDGGTSRFDKHGIIYQGICANCGGPASPPFPTTAGSWATLDASSNCNEAALKIAFNIAPVSAAVTAGPNTSGCAPLTVDFTNFSISALSYIWNFGDGSPLDTVYQPVHTFSASGTFTVTLTSNNSNACFRTSDSAKLTIVVNSNAINPSFTYMVNDSCGPYLVSFTNTSQFSSTPGSSTFTTFNWTFGDGSSYTGANPPIHNYPAPGTYVVKLVMRDSTACNSPDSVTQTFVISNLVVSAHFTIPDSICLGTAIKPVLSGTNVTNAFWDFGNGITTTIDTPTYTYPDVGTYTVTYVAYNPASCNGSDTLIQLITVLSAPVAVFSFSPVLPIINTPTTFTNLSINATSYKWDFNDGTTSTEVDPIHQFNKTGTFNTCLTAYNKSGCPSVYCRQVSADVVPIIGLPSGFSPNGDGQNEVLYVRGAVIQTMDLKIFNRWGQMVFETTNQNIGWDGTFNGQPQPVDAYAYVLQVTFIDGTARVLKGNVTLLR